MEEVEKYFTDITEQEKFSAEYDIVCTKASSYSADELLDFKELGDTHKIYSLCLEFTDVLGYKDRDGVLCGQGYTRYYPTEKKGVYFKRVCPPIWYGCDYTIPKGFVILTKDDYKTLYDKEDKVYEQGCLYDDTF